MKLPPDLVQEIVVDHNIEHVVISLNNKQELAPNGSIVKCEAPTELLIKK